ncbi:MATH and LRR domain-containing protein PFE0570w-like isoform X1 [Vespa velutina]|uniref:MATH and LRR domain-containing protein PFE0570w-like isoform X1 n=1 Tax=Vespa velutina TaxID=202808 RepID=UPI001FB38F34|nr:MATH and LRR domain-containing protein PFE0570w-like isoform X1 [Vespa velutina]
MSGSGFRGRGIEPRGIHPNGPIGAYRGTRLSHPRFSHPRLSHNRLPTSENWSGRSNHGSSFLSWSKGKYQRPIFRGISHFRPNGRGRGTIHRGNLHFPDSNRPSIVPYSTDYNKNVGSPKTVFMQNQNDEDQSEHVKDEPCLQQTPLLGSEEERQQKITETAVRLKEKLSTITKEDITNLWQDDLSTIPLSNVKDKNILNLGMLKLRHEQPELNLTFNDFKDIGRIDSDNVKSDKNDGTNEVRNVFHFIHDNVKEVKSSTEGVDVIDIEENILHDVESMTIINDIIVTENKSRKVNGQKSQEGINSPHNMSVTLSNVSEACNTELIYSSHGSTGKTNMLQPQNVLQTDNTQIQDHELNIQCVNTSLQYQSEYTNSDSRFNLENIQKSSDDIQYQQANAITEMQHSLHRSISKKAKQKSHWIPSQYQINSLRRKPFKSRWSHRRHSYMYNKSRNESTRFDLHTSSLHLQRNITSLNQDSQYNALSTFDLSRSQSQFPTMSKLMHNKDTSQATTSCADHNTLSSISVNISSSQEDILQTVPVFDSWKSFAMNYNTHKEEVMNIPNFNPQQPPPNFNNQKGTLPFNQHLLPQNQSNSTIHEFNSSQSSAVSVTPTDLYSSVNFTAPPSTTLAQTTSFSTLSQINIPSSSSFLSTTSINFSPILTHAAPLQMTPYEVPSSATINKIKHQGLLYNKPLDLAPISNQDNTFKSKNELQEMQEAMQFAKRAMNITDDVNINTESEQSLCTEIHLINTSVEQKDISDVSSSSTQIHQNINKEKEEQLDQHCNKFTKINLKERIITESHESPNFELEKQLNQNSDVEENALVNKQTRPKVMFHLNSKLNKINKQGKWHQNIEDGEEEQYISYLSPLNMHVKECSNQKIEECTNQMIRNNQDRTTKCNIEVKDIDTINSLIDESQKSNLESPISITSDNSTTQRPQDVIKRRKKVESPPSESSWKNRIISRFLKMSKNDIRNMINNSSLRKFDIAMKHLVKEKRSSLSLKMRNTEDEKIKSYDREEFMNQLNAMLDPTAIVDITNLPTDFIHHLSEVLQLDAIPLESNDSIFSYSNDEGQNNNSYIFSNEEEILNNIISEDINFEQINNKTHTEYNNQLKDDDSRITDSIIAESNINDNNIASIVNSVKVSENIILDSNEIFSKTPLETNDVQIDHFTSNVHVTEKDITPKNVEKRKQHSLFNVTDLDDILSTVTVKETGELKSADLDEKSKSTIKANKTCEIVKTSIPTETMSVNITSFSSKHKIFDSSKQHECSSGNEYISKSERYNRWTRKEREGPDAFRNLTKEEWEAKYGKQMRSLSSNPCKTQISRYSYNTNLKNTKYNRTFNSRKYQSSHSFKTNKNSLSHKSALSKRVSRKDNVEKDCNMSSSSQSETDDTSTSSDNRTPSDVTKLLKVIKEKEKIAKNKSLNETIRDEVTAEIQRKWNEEGRKRKYHKRNKRRKEKKLKYKKERKKKKRKIFESNSNSDNDQNDRSNLLTEIEIKKETNVKEESNTALEKSIGLDVQMVNNTSFKKQETTKTLIDKEVILENKDKCTIQESNRITLIPTIVQLKTKAELKLIPKASKCIEETEFMKNTAEIVLNAKCHEQNKMPILNNLDKQKIIENTSETNEDSECLNNKLINITETEHTVLNNNDNTIKNLTNTPTIKEQRHKEKICHLGKEVLSVTTEVKESNTEKLMDNKATSKKIDIKAYKARALQRKMENEQKINKEKAVVSNKHAINNDILNDNLSKSMINEKQNPDNYILLQTMPHANLKDKHSITQTDRISSDSSKFKNIKSEGSKELKLKKEKIEKIKKKTEMKTKIKEVKEISNANQEKVDNTSDILNSSENKVEKNQMDVQVDKHEHVQSITDHVLLPANTESVIEKKFVKNEEISANDIILSKNELKETSSEKNERIVNDVNNAESLIVTIDKEKCMETSKITNIKTKPIKTKSIGNSSTKNTNKDLQTKNINKDLQTKNTNKDLQTKNTNKDLQTKNINKDLQTKNTNKDFQTKNTNKDFQTKNTNKDHNPSIIKYDQNNLKSRRRAKSSSNEISVEQEMCNFSITEESSSQKKKCEKQSQENIKLRNLSSCNENIENLGKNALQKNKCIESKIQSNNASDCVESTDIQLGLINECLMQDESQKNMKISMDCTSVINKNVISQSEQDRNLKVDTTIINQADQKLLKNPDNLEIGENIINSTLNTYDEMIDNQYLIRNKINSPESIGSPFKGFVADPVESNSCQYILDLEAKNTATVRKDNIIDDENEQLQSFCNDKFDHLNNQDTSAYDNNINNNSLNVVEQLNKNDGTLFYEKNSKMNDSATVFLNNNFNLLDNKDKKKEMTSKRYLHKCTKNFTKNEKDKDTNSFDQSEYSVENNKSIQSVNVEINTQNVSNRQSEIFVELNKCEDNAEMEKSDVGIVKDSSAKEKRSSKKDILDFVSISDINLSDVNNTIVSSFGDISNGTLNNIINTDTDSSLASLIDSNAIENNSADMPNQNIAHSVTNIDSCEEESTNDNNSQSNNDAYTNINSNLLVSRKELWKSPTKGTSKKLQIPIKAALKESKNIFAIMDPIKETVKLENPDSTVHVYDDQNVDHFVIDQISQKENMDNAIIDSEQNKCSQNVQVACISDGKDTHECPDINILSQTVLNNTIHDEILIPSNYTNFIKELVNSNKKHNPTVELERIRETNKSIIDTIQNNVNKNTVDKDLDMTPSIKTQKQEKISNLQMRREMKHKSNTVHVTNTNIKEEIMARMIEIDLEIHKLMTEKMTLYQMLENDSLLLNKLTLTNSLGSEMNREKTVSIRLQTSPTLISQTMENAEISSVEHSNCIIKSNTNNGLSEINQDEIEPRIRNIDENKQKSSLREENINYTQSISSHSPKDGLLLECSESSQSLSIFKGEDKIQEDYMVLSDNQLKENLDTCNSIKESSTNVIKSTSLENIPYYEKEKHLCISPINVTKSCDENQQVEGTSHEEKKQKSQSFEASKDNNSMQVSLIYSDDSTWGSFAPSFEDIEDKKHNTGLALLEETYKREMAETRKLKANARKKKKKELNKFLKSVNYLTPEEEEIPLNTLYIKKLQQKRDLLDSLDDKRENSSINNYENSFESEKIWEHAIEVINAVAEDRVEDLYVEKSKENGNENLITSSSKSLQKLNETEPTFSLLSCDHEQNSIKHSSIITGKNVIQQKLKQTEKEENTIKDIEAQSIAVSYSNPEVNSAIVDKSNYDNINQQKISLVDETFTTNHISNASVLTEANQLNISNEKLNKDQNNHALKKNLVFESINNSVEATERTLKESDKKESSLVNQDITVNMSISEKLKYSNKIEENIKQSTCLLEDKGIKIPKIVYETDEIISNTFQISNIQDKKTSKCKISNKNVSIRRNSKSTEEVKHIEHDNTNLNGGKDSPKVLCNSKNVSPMHQELENTLSNTKRNRNCQKLQSSKDKKYTNPIENESSINYQSFILKENVIERFSSNVDSQALTPKIRDIAIKRKIHNQSEMMNCKVRLVDVFKSNIYQHVVEKFHMDSVKSHITTYKSTATEATINSTHFATSSKTNSSIIETNKSKDIKKIKNISDNVQEQISNLCQKQITKTHNILDNKKELKSHHKVNPLLNGEHLSSESNNKVISVTSIKTVPSIMKMLPQNEKLDIEIVEERKKDQYIIDHHHDEEIPLSDAITEDEQPLKRQYTVHKGPILDIQVFGNTFLAASEDGSIYRYSQTSNGILNIYKGHRSAVTCLYIHKSSGVDHPKNLVYSGSLDGTLRCYNIKTGVPINNVANVGSPIQCMDQAWGIIFIGTKSGHVSRFHIKFGIIKGDSIQFSDKSVLALKATNEGPRRVLIVASRNQPITIRDAQNGLFLRTICGQKNHTVYSLMRNNNLIYCGTSSTSILVFDFTNGEQRVQYDAGVGIVCMRLYHKLLFAGCYDGNIYVFDIQDHKLICSIPGPGNMLLSMEVVDNKIIAGSKDKRLHTWQIPKQVQVVSREMT